MSKGILNYIKKKGTVNLVKEITEDNALEALSAFQEGLNQEPIIPTTSINKWYNQDKEKLGEECIRAIGGKYSKVICNRYSEEEVNELLGKKKPWTKPEVTSLSIKETEECEERCPNCPYDYLDS